MTEHRWSGWPGAFCLDCGTEDQNEVCIAEHPEVMLTCPDCGKFMCEEQTTSTCIAAKSTRMGHVLSRDRVVTIRPAPRTDLG